MKILLDECVPRPFAGFFEGHEVQTVQQAGWASLVNGPLIKLAETQYEVFVTLDRGIQYQQNLGSTSLSVIVLRTKSNRLEDLVPLVPNILAALRHIKAGDIVNLHA